MTPELKQYIARLAAHHLHTSEQAIVFTPVGGGSINQTFRLSAGNMALFCKVNSAACYPALFEKEARGLQAIQATGCISTPAVIGHYQLNQQQILLLQWVESGQHTPAFWKNFGEALAKMHSWKAGDAANTAFGFDHDNYMGALPQQNNYRDNWCDFFREQRLMPQIALADTAGLLPGRLRQAFENLYTKLAGIFPQEPSSFLHGDLWSGNFICNERAQPVLVDPAVYFGHRSMDLAMTTLFGGFHQLFYEAYAHWLPLPPNHREQWEVCNLYPLLIHLNLFGESYLSSIAAGLRRFG
jgi:protein-ribulosamine 3-kinase